MSDNVKWNLYDYMLGMNRSTQRDVTIDSARQSLVSKLISSPAYQSEATKNGAAQPMGATRKNTIQCIFTALPDDDIYIGDIIGCFNENWLIMESKTDEYGLTTATGWLCNHLFHFQNHSMTIYERYGVIDDGSYASRDKKIATTAGKYTAYLPIDAVTRKLYVDKRLAVDVISNSEGNDILEVYKIIWIDTKSQNVGAGSHALKMELEKDVFNPTVDNIATMICDYISDTSEDITPINDETYACFIEGRNTIRVGTNRNYTVITSDSEGNPLEIATEFTWNVSNALPEGIVVTQNGAICNISVALDDSLIGQTIVISVRDNGGNCAQATKNVEVISIA